VDVPASRIQDLKFIILIHPYYCIGYGSDLDSLSIALNIQDPYLKISHTLSVHLKTNTNNTSIQPQPPHR